MPGLYSVLLLAHIISAAVLFGTGLGIAYFMLVAVRGGDAAHIALTARHVVWADAIFTAVAVIVQPATGAWLVYLSGFDPVSGWLVATYVLYAVAAAAWLPVVWLQLRLAELAKFAARDGNALPVEFHRLFRVWFILGWPGFLSVLGIYAMMVIKPAL